MRTYPEYKDSGVEWVNQIPKHWDLQHFWNVAKQKSVTNCDELELLSVYLNEGVIRFSEVQEKRTNSTSEDKSKYCLLYTSPSPRDRTRSRMPSSA